MLSSIVAALSKAVNTEKRWLSNPNGWRDMFHRCWYLGLTSFGGPAVHFQIVRVVSTSFLSGSQDELDYCLTE